jgi:predicted Zn-dependent peptidase
MDHLDAATLTEFQDLKILHPNNAVLVVAGDFNTTQTKEWIQQYFGSIKRELLLKQNFLRRTNH